jgi:hypothetical protein
LISASKSVPWGEILSDGWGDIRKIAFTLKIAFDAEAWGYA